MAKKIKEKIQKRIASNFSPKKLKLLVTIVNREKAEFYLDVLQGFEINLQTVVLGKGTANSEMLHYLGLAETKKAVIFSVIREDNISKALDTLKSKFEIIKNGKGIAFTIPFSSVIGSSIYQFLSNNRSQIKKGV